MVFPDLGSLDNFFAGKTYCHPVSLDALGYLRESATGIYTCPNPFKETYSHGQGVLIYLARYLRGGPISNKRIVRTKDGKVIFNYGRRKRALISLSVCEFIERFVQHVPGTNSIRVRSYGLYHHSCRDDLSICRMRLNQSAVEDPGFLDWQKICEEQGKLHPELCPVCGKRLVAKCALPVYKSQNELHSACLAVQLLFLMMHCL